MALHNICSDDQKDLSEHKSQLIIDITPELWRRIRAASAQNNLSVGAYVDRILEQNVPTEENSVQKTERTALNPEAIKNLLKTREEIMRAHPGVMFDSAEALQQIREERTKYLEVLL